MEEKDYITTIEEQEQTINDLAHKLTILLDNNEILKRKYNRLSKSHKELSKAVIDLLPEYKDALDNLEPAPAPKHRKTTSVKFKDLGPHDVTKYHLSGSAVNCLHKEGIEVVDEMFEKYPTSKDILQIRILGVRTLKEIITVFEASGYDLSQYKE